MVRLSLVLFHKRLNYWMTLAARYFGMSLAADAYLLQHDPVNPLLCLRAALKGCGFQTRRKLHKKEHRLQPLGVEASVL